MIFQWFQVQCFLCADSRHRPRAHQKQMVCLAGMGRGRSRCADGLCAKQKHGSESCKGFTSPVQSRKITFETCQDLNSNCYRLRPKCTVYKTFHLHQWLCPTSLAKPDSLTYPPINPPTVGVPHPTQQACNPHCAGAIARNEPELPCPLWLLYALQALFHNALKPGCDCAHIHLPTGPAVTQC